MPGSRPLANRLRSDVFAVCSGIATVYWLGWLWYLLAPRDALPAAFPPSGLAGVALAISMGLSVPMWVWMAVGCAIRLARERNPYLVLWLVAMALLWPAAWVYYFVEHRRGARRTEPRPEADR